MANNTELFSRMYRAVVDGDKAAAVSLANEAIEAGVELLEAIDEGYVPGIREAGRLWDEGTYFLPELVTSAQAMTAAMEVLQPRLAADDDALKLGRVVIGTVQGDIHDIGKTLVGTLLSANGFLVSDEGADVPVDRFVERASELGADLVCASALLTTTMTVQSDLIKKLREVGSTAKVMVGGAPVTQKWADEIGADGFADSAVGAVAVARRLVGDAS
jgi:trimethylamine corrinoid protein